MSKRKKTSGAPCGSGTGQEESSQQEEQSGTDMKQAMSRMMENCPCGPDMMSKMAGLMGGTSQKPAEPAPKKQE